MGIDLNYFLYSSPKQEVRDNNEDYLIESYHTSLSEVLLKLKYSKVPSLRDIKQNIRDFQFYGKYKEFIPLYLISNKPKSVLSWIGDNQRKKD